ncbi:unnamed protein product [Arabis nemorensis]|uniref:Uncharacterized protein n=1 Tax=Arabis nemorensis TaxID=586526 RepID=A0A565AMM0_9BRAS|nr:unnamed protein product [Arabis nemorensis]
MLSPRNHEFDQTSKAKVPFSWELKPGVSRKLNKSGDQPQWNLRPPPCSHVDYIEGVLRSPLFVCSFTPSNMIRTSRSNFSSFRKKEDDPFLEAYRKCLERSPIRVSSLGRNVRADQDCYAKGKKKSLLLWLWSESSCKVGTDGWSTVFRKHKSNKRINSTK